MPALAREGITVAKTRCRDYNHMTTQARGVQFPACMAFGINMTWKRSEAEKH